MLQWRLNNCNRRKLYRHQVPDVQFSVSAFSLSYTAHVYYDSTTLLLPAQLCYVIAWKPRGNRGQEPIGEPVNSTIVLCDRMEATWKSWTRAHWRAVIDRSWNLIGRCQPQVPRLIWWVLYRAVKRSLYVPALTPRLKEVRPRCSFLRAMPTLRSVAYMHLLSAKRPVHQVFRRVVQRTYPCARIPSSTCFTIDGDSEFALR
jgi:hypothetical protein